MIATQALVLFLLNHYTLTNFLIDLFLMGQPMALAQNGEAMDLLGIGAVMGYAVAITYAYCMYWINQFKALNVLQQSKIKTSPEMATEACFIFRSYGINLT